jgi:hypothetical protein
MCLTGPRQHRDRCKQQSKSPGHSFSLAKKSQYERTQAIIAAIVQATSL